MPRPSRSSRASASRSPACAPELIQPHRHPLRKDVQARLRGARPRQPHRRDRCRDATTSPTTSWSASVPGTWRCRPDGSKLYTANGLTNDMTDHRRGDAEGTAIGPGRPLAVGHRAEAVRACAELGAGRIECFAAAIPARSSRHREQETLPNRIGNSFPGFRVTAPLTSPSRERRDPALIRRVAPG